MSRLAYQDCAIANGAALSNICDLRNHRIVAIEMPAAWTAASITFQSIIRDDAGGQSTALTETFLDVYDSAGAEVAITAAASHYIVLTDIQRQELAGLGRTKIRSGTTGTPVNQGAARTVRLVVEPRESNT